MKIINGPRLIVLSLLLLSGACHPKEVSRKKLVAMIQHDATLNQEREVNGIKIAMKYIPGQLLVAQELENKGAGGIGELPTLERKYEGQYYFRLSLSKDGKELARQAGSAGQYSDMIRLLSFELGKYVNASTETVDSLGLSDYAFEQDFGMSTENKILLVFRKKDFDRSDRINVNVGEFGLGTGSMRFVFSKHEMKGLPALDYRQVD